MIFWRITSTNWALDKCCEGTRTFGGRWNPVGIPAMYAGTTVEICALEKFTHLYGVTYPPLDLVSIEIPDDKSLIIQPAISSLPKAWSELPTSASAQEYVPEATNAVINTLHPAYKDVRLKKVRDFTFDARMFKA